MVIAGILVGSVAPMGVLMGPMMCGIFMCFFAMMRNEQPTFSLLFQGFDVFIESLVALLVQVGVSIGVMILLFGVLVVGAIKVLALRDWATKIHARMFQVDEEWVRRSYFMFFVYYKIAILVLNLVPYIALSIMM